MNGFKVRESRVLRRLKEGKPAFSMKVNTADARVVEMIALHDIDCIWTDLEHTPNDWSVVEKQIYAAKAYDTDVCVRVRKGSYSDYIQPLELDATSIMVPHIMSAEEAREIARTTKFYPQGRRPLDGGNADGLFCNISSAEYIEKVNQNRFIIVQIEDPEAIDSLDEIAAVDGIDMLFFGPGDYSHRLGVAGQLEHPEVARVRRLVSEACQRNNKYAGTVASVSNAQEYLDMGYRFLNLGSDVGAMRTYMLGVSKFMRQFD